MRHETYFTFQDLMKKNSTEIILYLFEMVYTKGIDFKEKWIV